MDKIVLKVYKTLYKIVLVQINIRVLTRGYVLIKPMAPRALCSFVEPFV